MHVSIIIPAYNEETRIGTTLEAIGRYLAQQPYEAEVILVDDGSKDNTVAVAREAFPHLRVVAYQPNRGKGCAIRTGMLESKGQYRLYTDADASTPIDDLDQFWPAFKDGADVVFGSRMLPESEVAVRQPWHREAMGRAFNGLLRLFALTPFRDTQCGFKAFTAEAAELVFSLQQTDGFVADVEVLYIALLHKLKVVEVPVQWRNSADSRVRLSVDPVAMFWDMLRVRYYALRGCYKRPSRSSGA